MTSVPSVTPTIIPASLSSLSSGTGRGLSPAFLAELDRLVSAPEGQWWRDVLAHPDVVVAVRRDALNVYHRGASIFLAEWMNGRVEPKTHVKYLVRQRQAYAVLDANGDCFALDGAETLWHHYEGAQTLAEMLRVAASLAGPEKIGLHALLIGSPHVVDVEIVLQGLSESASTTKSSVPTTIQVATSAMATTTQLGTTVSASDAGDERAEIVEAIETAEAAVMEARTEALVLAEAPSAPASASLRTDRLDVATLEEQDGIVHLVFHEAKHFANKELRAGPGHTPPVLDQITRYRAKITQHQARLVQEYAEVCRSLRAIHAMRTAVRADAGPPSGMPLHPLIARVADGAHLVVDPEPRLLIFGFDDDQRTGKVWGQHRQRLEAALGARRFYAVGNTKAKTGAAFR